MRYTPSIEFANYTLTFGSEKVLLDLFAEIVEPSFEDQKYVRRTGSASWFFLNTQLVTLRDDVDPPIIGLAGRIVKKTTLRRTQIITADSRLLEDQQELDTAPSSIFLLLLNNHRLLFCREMRGAPDIDIFARLASFACASHTKTISTNKLKASV